MSIEKPAVRPANPHFSSGPCAKIPGWTPDLLRNALTGRSHRSRDGKARLKEAIALTREILEVPDSHRIAIVPASDTGAVEIGRPSSCSALSLAMFSAASRNRSDWRCIRWSRVCAPRTGRVWAWVLSRAMLRACSVAARVSAGSSRSGCRPWDRRAAFE